MNHLIEFFKSISDETRLRILVLLSRKEMCVCELCEVLEESQPKVSRHLARLRDMGYVRDERQGQWVFYYTNFADSVHEEIMNTILNKIENYPQLMIDVDRFNRKSEDGSMCARRLREEV
ncbi:metalloregulator ArsR/SmtB family transcription factor [Fusibacter sp. 3D3]|uniref:ArsR/SmtB family transcription factor n=1 Tax=Fusibacter sp. 3D3 TaxID=1048380 RepID=UPI000852BA6B|nr:metalloregulator ArsR/SmtB family transcription factor [Fusibacter sp. 3D3]